LSPLVPEPLLFPRGVRFARADELPAHRAAECLVQLAEARITTGYVLRPWTDGGFTAFFEANVHADLIWTVFHGLVKALVPEIAGPIVGIKDEDPVLCHYTDRDSALATLEPHAEALQHDGLLEFGLIYQYQGRTEEVFVRAAKYVRIWTNAPRIAMSVLERHGIPQVETLQFLDEFPRVSYPFQFPDGTRGGERLLTELTQSLEKLRRRFPGDEIE
jgi:hypothetical protein